MLALLLLTFAVGGPPNGSIESTGSPAELPPPRQSMTSEVVANSPHAAPPTVRTFQGQRLHELELRQALLIAIQSNKSVAVARYLPEQAATQIVERDAGFDPLLAAGTQWAQSDTEVSNTVETAGTGAQFEKLETFGPARFGLTKPLRTGGTLQADFSPSYRDQQPAGAFNRLNPAWNSEYSFQWTQPLLQGAGFHLNKLPILIAQLNYEISSREFEVFVNELLRSVELAYWELALAYAESDIRGSALDYTKSLLDIELKRLKLGESTLPEVQQAREQYQRARLTKLQADNGILEAERILRQLLGIPGFDGTRLMVPADPVMPAIDHDWDIAVARRMQKRPELAS